MSNVHFSSKIMTWETPQDFYDNIAKQFDFVLDVCATATTAKCDNYYTPINDALTCDWAKAAATLGGGYLWMNPPYGREIGKWMDKAYRSYLEGVDIVCLVPSRTDTKWWHDYAMKGEIFFVKGRLKFGNATNSAPFPSAVVIFRNRE